MGVKFTAFWVEFFLVFAVEAGAERVEGDDKGAAVGFKLDDVARGEGGCKKKSHSSQWTQMD